jgi:fatty-acyl-CoA synthase/long-chain acyl-CoA synthetase
MRDYPGGSQFPTLDQYYERVFREHRESTAIRTEQQSISYGTLDERTAKMANVFRSLGLGPDDLIGVLMGNRLEYLVTQIGAVRAGAVAVPLNDQLDDSELEQTLTDAQIQTLVVGPTWVETVQSIQQSGLVFNYLIGIGDGETVPIGFHDYQTLLAKADDTPPAIDQSPDDVAVIYYTGGTTGRPKGAMHTHSGLLLNIYNHVYELDVRKNERMLLVTPLGHSAGFFARAALGQGGQVLLQDEFAPECVLRTLDEERISWVYLIPTMIGELLDHYGRAERSVATLSRTGRLRFHRPVWSRASTRSGTSSSSSTGSPRFRTSSPSCRRRNTAPTTSTGWSRTAVPLISRRSPLSRTSSTGARESARSASAPPTR